MAIVYITSAIGSVTVTAGGNYRTGDPIDGYDNLSIDVSHTVPASPPTGLGGADYNDFGTDDDGKVWVTGTVFDLVIDDQGGGYSTAPTMTADNTDGGSGATFTVMVNDGGGNFFMDLTAGGSGYVVEGNLPTSPDEVDVEYDSDTATAFSLGMEWET